SSTHTSHPQPTQPRKSPRYHPDTITIKTQPKMSDLPIIDSHIHLYPEAEIPTLAWCNPGHPLASERSVPQFDAITAACPTVKGFILVETDRKSDLSEEGWDLPLKEVAWFARVATG